MLELTDKNGYPIFTGEAKDNLKLNLPHTYKSVNNKKIDFKPEFKIRRPKNNPKISEKNNLKFVAVKKNGVTFRKVSIGVESKNLIKGIPKNHNLVIDVLNKRAKLIGLRSSPEWVEIAC